jgi:hypothetical protein
MSFGYNAKAAFGNSTANIIDHAKDLLSSLIDEREEDNVSYPRSASLLKAKMSSH